MLFVDLRISEAVICGIGAPWAKYLDCTGGCIVCWYGRVAPEAEPRFEPCDDVLFV